MAVTQYTTNLITCTAVNDAVTDEMFIWKVVWYGGAINNGDVIQLSNNDPVPQVLFNEAADVQENSNVSILNIHSKTGFKVTAMSGGSCDIYCTLAPYALTTKVPVAVDYI